MENPELRERMVSQGANPDFMGAAQFKTFLEGEMPRWADAVKRSGTKMD
jgi:tripartite-type tricarboxylate transporter receptor subunit TctC